MEYKEQIKKNGQRLIFCDFKELLTEAYNVNTIEEVEPFANDNGEYIIHCPFCREEGHTKHKLYIKKDLTVGHCFVCTRTYINVTTDINLKVDVPDTLTDFCLGQGSFKLVPLTDQEWTVDKFEYEFDDYSEKGIDYLIKRNQFLSELYKFLDFKFWNDNVVIPFKYHGEVFYYQIRFRNPGAKIKYFLPPIDKKPPYIIERDEEFRHKIVIVEGIFDAIAALIQCPEYTPVAVLGSSISDYQLDFIRDYSGYIDDIRIWMDETKISLKIAEKVKSVIDYAPIRIIKSYGPDPEEVLAERLRRNLPIQWIYAKDNTQPGQ
jgi:transcription elongation factor Elf1